MAGSDGGTGLDGAATRVLVVDDHQTFAELLCLALDGQPDLVSVGHATSVEDGVRMCAEIAPDVVVMDVQLPDGDGIDATRRITEAHPDVRVVVLTAHTAPDLVARAAAAGASGFLPKDGELALALETVRAARRGQLALPPGLLTRLGPSGTRSPQGPELTGREQEVLELMGRGLDVRTIARDLGITPNTCRGYVKSLLLKLGAHTQLEAVVIAARRGLLRLDASP